MTLAEQIIERGPYSPGDVIPWIDRALTATTLNELRNELIKLRALCDRITEFVDNSDLDPTNQRILMEIVREADR